MDRWREKMCFCLFLSGISRVKLCKIPFCTIMITYFWWYLLGSFVCVCVRLCVSARKSERLCVCVYARVCGYCEVLQLTERQLRRWCSDYKHCWRGCGFGFLCVWPFLTIYLFYTVALWKCCSFLSVHAGLADSICGCGVLVYIHTLQNTRRDKEQQREGRRGLQASLPPM